MKLLCHEDEKKPVRSLFDDRVLRFPSFVLGEAIPLEVGRLAKIKTPFDARLFQPEDISGYTVQASLGGGYVLPLTGTWPIAWEDDESDSIIPANPTAEEIASALNDLDTIRDAGGVTVQGEAGFFTFTFNEAGARTLLSGNTSQIVPLTLLDFETVTTGDVDTQAVQILRIVQNAGTVSDIETDSAAGSITVETLQTGGTGQNHQIRITISDDVYGGKWTLGIVAEVSGLIGFDDNAEQVKTVLEAMTAIGAGNVDVQQENDSQWFVEFIGSKAATSIAGITVEASNLRAIGFKTGELDLRTPGVELLLNDSNSRVVSLEITATPSGGTPKKILHQDVLLVRPVTDASTTQPQPSEDYLTESQIEALSGSTATVNVSTAGTTDIAPAAHFFQWFVRIVAAVGSGAYTRRITLDTANAIDGAQMTLVFQVAASANPTIQIYNESVSGTLIDTVTGDVSNAVTYTLECRFTNGAWEFASGEFDI